MSAAADTLDPVTFEVIRHRLWAINDEAALRGARMSASPAVYDAYDFNSALLTPEGESIYVGVYVSRHGTAIDMVAKAVIGLFGDDVHDGDVFVTNDPWSGAVHQNDFCAVAPIFFDGRPVMWTGITMHELDVGGPTPGGFTIGASDAFGEPPLVPPVRLVAGGEVSSEVERLLLRNSRTPTLNAMNLRARFGAINLARERVVDMFAEYGGDTVVAAVDKVISMTRDRFGRRLRELPEGSWSTCGYLDHDGNSEGLHAIELKLENRDGQLTFDFRGSAPQTGGSINCTRSGLVGGVMGALLPMLCFDMPWCPGGVAPRVSVLSDPGTIVDATFPAGVSMASIDSSWMVTDVANVAIGQMLGSSAAYQHEAQACWMASPNSFVISYPDARGQTTTTVLMAGIAGGGGARGRADGVDTGAYLVSAFASMPNAERDEQNYPVLELFRRQLPDSGGAGTHRGGVGIEYLVVPHGCDDGLEAVLISHGSTHPIGAGLFGGHPGSVSGHVLVREAGVRAEMAAGRVPVDVAEGPGWDVLPSKGRFRVGPDDALWCFASGGGGFGDPLERAPAAVERDVGMGLESAERARDVYGVVLDGDGLALHEETTEARAAIRRDRLARASRDGDSAVSPLPAGYEDLPDLRLGPAVGVASDGTDALAYCLRCGSVYGPAEHDPRRYALALSEGIERASDVNRFGRTDDFRLRQHVCAGCGGAVATDVHPVRGERAHEMGLRTENWRR